MPPDFLTVVDILGTAAFAVSGALAAMEHRLDPFGVLIIAFVTAIGGGTLRDVLVGNVPVSWLHNPTAIFVITLAAVAAMLFGSYLKHFTTTLFLFDALGLGLFTLTGLEIGMRYGLSAGICVALGTITASFGGVIRDVLLNKVPLIFQKEIYALSCVIGGSVYYAALQMGVQGNWLKIACILLVFFIRIIAVRYRLSLPRISVK